MATINEETKVTLKFVLSVAMVVVLVATPMIHLNVQLNAVDAKLNIVAQALEDECERAQAADDELRRSGQGQINHDHDDRYRARETQQAVDKAIMDIADRIEQRLKEIQ